jgi:oligosaccharyl transferase (archaeosortase A-associated)
VTKKMMANLPAKIGARLSTRARYGLILLAIFAIALSIRIWLPYDGVFVGDWIRFGGNDPWYNLRLVENTVQHFPYRIAFDPFTLYPYGQAVPFAPFWDWFIGFVAWLVGLGHPSQHTVEVVTAYFPAVFGALITVPVYFIGKELFNRKVGLLAAALVAVLPGEFLARTMLGFSDHHAAEVLFSTIAILFFIITLKRARERAISFEHIWSRDWRNIRKPLFYAILTGIALGIYLLSWIGGILLVFIIFVFIILQYIIDYLRGKSTDYLCIIGVPIFLIALIIIAPFLNQLMYHDLTIGALVIAMLALPLLSGVCWLMDYRDIKRAYYPLVLAGIGLVAVLCFYVIDPSLFSSMWAKFTVFTPGARAETIAEVRGLLSTGVGFWDRFTTSFIIALLAMALVAYTTVRERSPEKLFLLVWTLVMLIATLGQVRFSYYLAVNVALLSGYLCWKIPGWVSAVLSWIGFREPRIERRRRPRARERRMVPRAEPRTGSNVEPRTGSNVEPRTGSNVEPRTGSRAGWRGFRARFLRPKYVSPALSILIVFFLVFYPNSGFYPFTRSIGQAMQYANNPGGPGSDWHDSLVWMRDNTPDPFEDPDFFYQRYESPPSGEAYPYPESAYGVMSWWDYGHWITTIAHRIPNSNPFQAGAVDAGLFFTCQNETEANEMLDKLGSKYVIIDYEMAVGKFYAMVTFADKSPFFEYYYDNKTLQPILYYYPEYYNSMCSRLYNFGGEAVGSDRGQAWVISYEDREITDPETGNRYVIKVVTSQVLYTGLPTYEEAKAYEEAHPGQRIVGTSRWVSCISLEPLEHYELIHKSDSTVVSWTDGTTISYVEIFEYVP